MDGNSYRCPKESCGKNFRKENLLQVSKFLDIMLVSSEIIKVIYKKYVTRRRESDTYLATVSRHRWSREITMKIDRML